MHPCKCILRSIPGTTFHTNIYFSLVGPDVCSCTKNGGTAYIIMVCTTPKLFEQSRKKKQIKKNIIIFKMIHMAIEFQINIF